MILHLNLCHATHRIPSFGGRPHIHSNFLTCSTAAGSPVSGGTSATTCIKRNSTTPACLGYSGVDAATVALEGQPKQAVPQKTHAPCVFKVECVKDRPRFDMPLLLGSISTCTRSAFACTFDGHNYLVTAASAVSYCTQVNVYKPGISEPFKAKVEHISLECELAILTILSEDATPATPRVRASIAPVSRAVSRGDSRGGTRTATAHHVSAAQSEDAEEEMDLEERFWQGVHPLCIGSLPALQQSVQILAAGGDDSQDGEVHAMHTAANKDSLSQQNTNESGSSGMASGSQNGSSHSQPAGSSSPHPSSTLGVVSHSGVVSSVQVVAYPSSLQSLLGLVISAKVGSSSIGAPVVAADGTCIGMVMKRTGKKKQQGARHGTAGRRRLRPSAGAARGGIQEAQAVAVPTPLLQRFLADAAQNEGFQGLPSLSIQYKVLTAAPMRESLGMAEGQQGILILAINPWSAASQVLQPGDVLMSINGLPVNNDGKVAFREDEHMLCSAYLAQQQVGSQMDLVVFRAGLEVHLSFRLDVPPRLLPTHLGNARPSYLVLGGLVLTRCSVPYLQSAFGPHWPKIAPVKLLDKLTDFPRVAGEEVVVAAECQPLPCLDGYQAGTVQHRQVIKFNGTPVVNMRQLVKEVFECKTEYMRLDLEGGMVVSLLTSQAMADTKLMLKQYEVKLAVSDDLIELLPNSTTPKPQRTLQSLKLQRRGQRS